MNIGELFLTLGVKGTDKTVGALTGVKKGLKDTASMSLEAKAAIVGVFYAMERLFAASGKRGTDLTNFAASTGVASKTLQQYQYAARQVGASNEDVEATFKSLQQAMTKTLMGQGAPAGLARVAQLTGSLSASDINEWAKKPELLIQRLTQYAQKEFNVGLRNEVLKSFGISEGMIAAMTRNAFRPEVLARAPVYSDKEVDALDSANIKWKNLGTTIEMAIGHFNARHGGELVDDIAKIIPKISSLAEKLDSLATKMHVFQAIGMIFDGWADIIQEVTDGITFIQKLSSPDKKTSDAAASTLKDNLALAPGTAVAYKDAIFDWYAKTFLQGGASEAMEEVARRNKEDADRKKKGLPALRRDDGFNREGSGDGSAFLTELFARFIFGGDTAEQIAKYKREHPYDDGSPRSPAGFRVPALIAPQPATTAPINPAPAAVAQPKVGADLGQTSGGVQQNVQVAQTLNFQHDGTDAQQIGDTHKKAINQAFRQLPSLTRIT